MAYFPVIRLLAAACALI